MGAVQLHVQHRRRVVLSELAIGAVTLFLRLDLDRRLRNGQPCTKVVQL